VIQASIIALVVVSLALSCRSRHSDSRTEALRRRMKIIFLVLGVCILCSRAVVHTYSYFNPPSPPIIGP